MVELCSRIRRRRLRHKKARHLWRGVRAGAVAERLEIKTDYVFTTATPHNGYLLIFEKVKDGYDVSQHAWGSCCTSYF